MSWWGKALGGAFGFMVGGPLGALMGIAFGHSFDRGMGQLEGGDWGEDKERTQAAFFTATFSVMGYIAKSDGRVSQEAAVGLFLDSAAVIIGAMLLAPLMTPIVSLAMGVLRGDHSLQKNSAIKIIVGVVIALLASACFSLLFPHKPVTSEMLARINPTLLDLAVAVLSGIAAAYAKSYREIIQNLAGVAIAVALVPPLAVAGIGIGNLDLSITLETFLI